MSREELDVAEMSSFRWMMGKPRRNRIKNKRIRDRTGLAQESKKAQGRQLSTLVWACDEERLKPCQKKDVGLVR